MTTITSAGAQPTDPQTLRANLLAIALGLDPGLTANLPGSLIEDITSTDVGALTVTDSAYVDLINSVAPTTANPFILNQLGQTYGVPQGIAANGSVYVVFTGSAAGFTINRGFTVTDGTYQYVVQDGGIVPTGLTTDPLFCLAAQSGTFPIPANTVNALSTSVPSPYVLTCNNPTPGLPATAAQTLPQYQAQVIQAGYSTAQGMPAFLKTQLEKVVGVQARLVSIKQNGSNWIVTCGGGDPYQVAYAIFQGVPDIANLAGCTLGVSAITNANPGVVTTNIAHGYSTGQIVMITGATGISGINGTPLTITVTGPYTFSIGINTTSSGAYTGSGILTPNLRNLSIAINDYPDTYTIPFVNPLQETVTVALTWNTNSLSFVNPAAVAALGNPAIVGYINSISTGQPINVFDLQAVFQESVASILPTPLITRMVFDVTINGVSVSPTSGTGIIPGDAFSYFQTSTPQVVIVQG